MKTVSFQYQTELIFSSSASDHSFLLRILPQNDNRQKIKKISWRIDPGGVMWRTSDSFGNEALSGYIAAPHDNFRFGIQGTAEVSEEPYVNGTEPPRAFLYPSALTQSGGRITEFFKDTESSAPRGKEERIQHFSRAVHGCLSYERGVTVNTTTAQEAFEGGKGVCQDYAHILIALLRMDKIPCRYTAGLASEYGETHAWVEAWTGERYLCIDPTRDKMTDEGYIALSRGRDFEDCSIERGVFSGACRGKQTINLNMEISQ